jgi:hypothetical protein
MQPAATETQPKTVPGTTDTGRTAPETTELTETTLENTYTGWNSPKNSNSSQTHQKLPTPPENANVSLSLHHQHTQ